MNLIREIFDYILSLLKSRIVPLVAVFLVLLSVIINRIFSLQIVNGESYVKDLTSTVQKTTSVAATRGRIFDRNGVLLAYNDLAFSVRISDSGTYKDTTEKNIKLNKAIDKTLDIIESKGDKFTNDFPVEATGYGGYDFTVSGNTLLRLKRDIYGTRSISELTDEQKNATADDMISYLCERYGIEDGQFTSSHLLEIINLRRYMSANSYNRYISFVIANEVSDETVAAILENSDELIGVTIEEQYIRRYVDSVYCSQILGYTGTVSASELENLQREDDSYEVNDVVGKTGIEKTLETELAGEKGSKTVYVDTVGRITEVLDETEPKAGNDVYLTIDINLQKKIYNEIEDEIVKILLEHFRPVGSAKSVMEAGNSAPTIYIPMNEAYFALIDNNIVSLDDIASGKTSNEQNIYNTFLGKKAEVLSWLRSELTDSPTAYGSLSEENQKYVWYVYQMLTANKVLNKDSIDTSDDIYTEWTDGSSINLEELLKHAISQNWIDMTMLTEQQYSSLQESYDLLLDYIIDELDTDDSFYKKMYNYMIESGSISGNQVCMLLFEQGVLEDDSQYQALKSGALGAYDFMVNAVSTKTITPAQLALKPCSGSCVITNPNNGDVLALVSYPSYDNNKMSGSVDADYYKQLSEDKSKPLLNWATQSQTAPGSVFKVCTSIAGLDTGILGPGTAFYCSGAFDKVTPSPRCWRLSGHGTETVTTAIRDSCNVFFYNVGWNLACSKDGNYNSTYGTSIMQKYAEELGLATTAGIEIDEKTPHASNISSIQSAIGQGTHQYSCLNLARYVTTIANTGTCYNLTLVDKITDAEGNLVRDNSAEVSNTVDVSSTTWSLVHTGMQMAGETYAKLNQLGYKIAAKTGTAQERTTEPDHATIISFAPYDNPEVAVAVVMPNGYASSSAIETAANVYKSYYGADEADKEANAD